MSDRITQLDDMTIRQIAAGEVVERPASVVKELVENSLDADADRIDVTVEEGGTDRIVVSDDGIGMSEADLRASVREHTTSKIEDIGDLESGVGTLGFRGEALHTIGAVSRITISSKPRGGEREGDGEAKSGTELQLEGGEVESVGPAGCPEGTIIEVSDLFYNTPARRKYLKTTTTEFSHVNTVVTRYALANPDVAVSLTHDDREVFATTGRGDLQSALLSVYGREVATSMIQVDGGSEKDGNDEGGNENDEDEECETKEDEAAVTISGYVSDPETTRSTREYMSTYVNDRYVSSSVVRKAVLSAYGGQLSAKRYPFAVLFVEVPPSEVDVNVHPRKMKCRWSDESAVEQAVETAVEDALLDHGLVRSSAPRGRSAPDETSVEPERESDETGHDAEGEQAELTAETDDAQPEQSTLDGSEPTEETSETTKEISKIYEDGRKTREETSSGDTTADDSDGSAARTRTSPRASERGGGHESAGAEPRAQASDPERTDEAASAGESVADATDSPADRKSSATDRNSSATDRNSSDTDQKSSDSDRKFSAPTESGTLADDSTGDSDAEFETLPRMRVLGQLHDTYVVAETPEGLVLVDQHAADERVNYERLQAEFADDSTTQMLAQSVELELTAGEAAVFEEYREALERLGFRAELAEGENRQVTVRTAPTVLDETLDPELLRDALAEFVSTDPDDRGETVEAVADDLLADLACYPSITGNTSLREGSVVDLLSALDDCENPYACPHGRPVIIEFSEAEIEDRFERDYPGHAGRRAEE